MFDRGKGKGKGSGFKRPDKLTIVQSRAQTKQNPPTSPKAKLSSPAGTSSPTPHLIPPASIVGVNSPTPKNNGELTPGSSNSHDSLNKQTSSRKKVLHLDRTRYVINIFNYFVIFGLI